MKILLGHRDHLPGGFCRTKSHELLSLPRLRSPAAGLEAFIGTLSHGAATLAKVGETPTCFELKPPFNDDPYITRLLDLVLELPLGTLVRPRLSAQGKRLPDGALVPSFEWELDIVGPN